MNTSQLFDDYNRWRTHTNYFQNKQRSKSLGGAGQRMCAIRPTTAAGKSLWRNLEAMAEWCGEHQLDPRRWLCVRFDMLHWLRPPPFYQLVLKRPDKALNHYRDREIPVWTRQVESELYEHRQQAGQVFDSNRDISIQVEALKRRYSTSGNSARCMSEMLHVTYGYHPGSAVCSGCPRAGECAWRLQSAVPFDILALRRGELTAEQCRQTAGRARVYN